MSAARWLSLFLFLAVTLGARSAAAFHAGNVFDRPPGAGGGGGIFYAGAPLDRRWDCTTCHVEPQGKIRVRLLVEPEDLFTTFRYRPEQKYTFTASLEGEHRGLGSPRANYNGVTFQATDVAGLPGGTLTGAPTDFYEGGPALLTSAGQRAGLVTWKFEWTAPAAGAGRVYFHVAAVDGNGADGGPSSTITDPFGDDVFVTQLTFEEAGSIAAGNSRPTHASAGSSGAGSSGAGSGLFEPPATSWSARTTFAVPPTLPSTSSVALFLLGFVFATVALGAAARRTWTFPALEGFMQTILRRSSIVAITLSVGLACGGSDSQPDNPCPQGICGAPGSPNGGPGGSSGDGGSGGGGGGGGGCVPAWTCTPWVTNGSNSQATRTCTDANACNTGTKPAETADLPNLDRTAFECNVFPVLQQKCSQLGCHGTEQGRAFRVYARGRLRITGDTLKNGGGGCGTGNRTTESCIGGIECACFTAQHTAREKQANFDSARGFALDENGALLADPTQSDLLAQAVFGGKAHAGVHLYRETDPDYLAIKDWLAGGTLASCTDPNHNYN